MHGVHQKRATSIISQTDASVIMYYCNVAHNLKRPTPQLVDRMAESVRRKKKDKRTENRTEKKKQKKLTGVNDKGRVLL